MVFLVILILSFLLQLILPWWVIIALSFAICGIIGKTARISFWQPFFAILVLWTGVALFKSIPNQHILATRVAEMIGVKVWYGTLAVTAVAGGMIAAVSGICGYYFRKAILVKKV